MKQLAQIKVESSQGADINLSPLIDMVFLLLIFFMVTTVFVEETGIEIQKPTAASASKLEKKSILIAITAEGSIVYGGREVGVNGVRGLVTRLLQEQESPVILLTDQSARAGIVVDVIDECKLAGAKHVSVAASIE